MSFWKRIFEKKNSTEEHEVLSWLSRYCTSCGLGLPSGAGTVCLQCGHDQRASIIKKITNPHDMARAAISFVWNKGMENEYKEHIDEYIDDLVREYGTRVDQPQKDQLLNVFFLSDLAITSTVYLAHYEDNPKHDEIVECFREALDDCLLHVYGKEEFQEARNCLASMGMEYLEASTEKDWLRSVSKVLQYRAESLILGLPLPGKKLALPSIHAFMKYFVHISSFLPPLQATLNRWEIE